MRIPDPHARADMWLAALMYDGRQPVDFYALIERANLRVTVVSRPHVMLAGCDATFDGSVRTIYVRDGLTTERFMWCVMHELGHYDIRAFFLDHEHEERYANEFASYIMRFLQQP